MSSTNDGTDDTIEWEPLSARLTEQCHLWQAHVRSTASINRNAATKAVDDLYSLIGKESPLVVWCDSPFQVAAMAAVLEKGIARESIGSLSDPLKAYAPVPSENDFNKLWDKLWCQIDAQIAPERRGLLIKPDAHSNKAVEEQKKANWMLQLPGQQPLRSPWQANTISRELWSTLGKELRAVCHLRLGSDKRFATLEEQYRAAMGNRIERRVATQLQMDMTQLVASVPGLTKNLESIQSPNWQSVLSFGTEAARGNLQKEVDKLFPPEQRKSFELMCSMMFSGSMMALQNVSSIGLLPFYDCLCRQVTDLPVGPTNRKRLQIFLELVRHSQYYLLMDRMAFVCERPVVFKEDQTGRLHSENGPAIAFGDGYKLYSWHGSTVPRRVIDNPTSVTTQEILGQWNVEVRRVMIERYGPSKFIEASGAQKIHEDECGILYRKELPGDEALVMVKVLNSTPEPDGTRKTYFLRVPPTTKTAREAVAWTFDTNPDEYSPAKQT